MKVNTGMDSGLWSGAHDKRKALLGTILCGGHTHGGSEDENLAQRLHYRK